MTTLAARHDKLVSDLLVIDDAQERLAAVVDRARSRAPLTPGERSEENRVKGCVSLAWVTCELEDGVCRFRGDADSPLVRGLVTLLCDFYDGAAPADVAATEPAFLDELGIARSLSPTRLNGLRSVRARIREFALSNVAPAES